MGRSRWKPHGGRIEPWRWHGCSCGQLLAHCRGPLAGGRWPRAAAASRQGSVNLRQPATSISDHH